MLSSYGLQCSQELSSIDKLRLSIPRKIARLVALWKAIMLPQDVSDLAVEDSEEFGGKLIMMEV